MDFIHCTFNLGDILPEIKHFNASLFEKHKMRIYETLYLYSEIQKGF